MNIWWCEFHEAAGFETDCDLRHQSPRGSCRMVRMEVGRLKRYIPVGLYVVTALGALWVAVIDTGWTPEASFWVGALFSAVLWMTVWMIVGFGDR